jgi:hypothetical protein
MKWLWSKFTVCVFTDKAVIKMKKTMISRSLMLRTFLLFILVAMSLSTCSCVMEEYSMLEDAAVGIQNIVQGKLDKLDIDMSEAAVALGKTGLSGTESRQILDKLYQENNFVVDCCATDVSGKMITIMPDTYSSYEGTDISQQDVTLEFNKTRKPMLSNVFTAVEGFDAVVLIWPVISGDDENIGSLSVLFKPETLFDEAVKKVSLKPVVSVNAMQVNGSTIYDSDDKDTGTNLLTDPRFQSYAELVSLGHKIADEDSGTGSYSYLSGGDSQVVKKQAYWLTVSLHGTDWRVVAVSEAAE